MRCGSKLRFHQLLMTLSAQRREVPGIAGFLDKAKVLQAMKVHRINRVDAAGGDLAQCCFLVRAELREHPSHGSLQALRNQARDNKSGGGTIVTFTTS
jgi:hypothetical protein